MAERHVRSLSVETALSLMATAGARGSSYQGFPGPLHEEMKDFPQVYLVPHLATRIRSGDVRCVLVLVASRGRVTWAGLDVSPWSLLTLRKVTGRRAVSLIGALAGGHPVAAGGEAAGSDAGQARLVPP